MRRLEAPPGGFRHIAVIRLSSLGDVVLTLPAVRALKLAYPGAKLDYWTKEEYADVVRHDPAVAHVRELDRDARRIEDLVSMSAELEDCDLIVDLHSNLRTPDAVVPAAHPGAASAELSRAPRHARACALAETKAGAARGGTLRRGAGAAGAAAGRRATAPLRRGQRAAGRMRGSLSAGCTRPVALAPGARHATKRWLESYWCALADRLARAGVPVVAFSLASERAAMPELSAQLERAGAAWCCEPLPRMAALLSRCRVAVSCDSGLMHVAAARGIPVVAMFGSTAPELGFAPGGRGSQRPVPP